MTDCSLINGQVKVHMSFNKGKSNVRQRESMSGLSDVQMRYGDGNLYCKFTRESPLTVQNMVFDLSEPHYLLLARGQAFDGNHRRANRRRYELTESFSFGRRWNHLSRQITQRLGRAGQFCPSGTDWSQQKYEMNAVVNLCAFNVPLLAPSPPDVGVKVHGAMMVAAWVCAASMGILFARYYRQTWVGKQFMGKDLWFVVSVSLWCPSHDGRSFRPFR